jgi:hypothetical protein
VNPPNQSRARLPSLGNQNWHRRQLLDNHCHRHAGWSTVFTKISQDHLGSATAGALMI